MMTAMGELPDRNERAHKQPSGADAKLSAGSGLDMAAVSEEDRLADEQLELFGVPSAGSHDRLPKAANLDCGEAEAASAATLTETATAGAEDSGPTTADDEALRRLQASVRWLQDESESYQPLPRAANLPPASHMHGAGLRFNASPRAGWAQFDPDEPANASAVAYPDDPRRRLPGRAARRRTSTGLRNLLVASVIAVPPAYFIAKWQLIPGYDVLIPGGDLMGSAARSLAALEASFAPAAHPSRSVEKIIPPATEILPAPEQTGRKSEDAATENAGAFRTAAVEPVVPAVDPAPVPVATPAEAAVNAPTTPQPAAAPASLVEAALTPGAIQDRAIRDRASQDRGSQDGATQGEGPAQSEVMLNPRETALWFERGRDFFEAGDVAAARLLFRRAANAGDAAAALAMGTTYDPAVLANRMVRGVGADPEQARIWYEKARALGSPEGPRRIEMLAHR
jgi:hypothetical protein